MNLLKKFVRDEAGMETVEWAIMAALIVAGVIGIVAGIGTNVNNAFTKLETATTPVP
jgi:Flp pilus assembly pilin Flp